MPNTDYLRYLEELRQIPTLSGFENAGQKEVQQLLAPLFDESRPAGVSGLLFTKKCSRENAPVLLIDAHLDEIGLIVTDLKDDGTLTVSSLGGMDARTYTASSYTIHGKENMPALSLKKPYCLGGPEARKLPKNGEFWLFTGFTKEELIQKGVAVGTPVSMERSTESVSEEQLCGAYMDDKSCAVAALIALEELKGKDLSCDICLLLSGQEESYGAGFRTGVFDACPDEILVVDVDLGNTPETDAAKTVKPGEGPSVAVSVQTDRKMTKELLRIAREREIPVQPAMNVKSTGTNASSAPFLLGGVPTAVIGLPLKYMHTCVETLYKKDLLNTGRLIAAYIEERFGKGGTAE